ncbi:MAG: M23 family metallopeptidase [Dethiobacter sp.]|jgi:murein DD-endopeptidase MepM/ murein hydrolase activator NlpD|nr:M23 family metallopeptidase [Dethiobacter sp.]
MELLPTCRRVFATALCGLLLTLPVPALAYVSGIYDFAQAAAQTTPSITPLYLEQLMILAGEKELPEEPVVTEHRVLRGETLSAIARKYDTTVNDLVKLNNLRNANYIREGQVLNVVAVPPPPVIHQLMRGETIWDLARRYSVSMDVIIEANNITDPHRVVAGQKLVVPGATVTAVAKAPVTLVASRSAPRTAPVPATFIWPTQGRITSGYGPRWGRFHYGIDIADKAGTPIKAVAAGTVVESGWRSSYGYMLRIDHNNGWESLYAHASKLYVSTGAAVTAGYSIAAVGQTGNATGPHLHFELLWQGQNVSPLNYLPKR